MSEQEPKPTDLEQMSTKEVKPDNIRQLPQEPQLSDEEIMRRKSADEQQIKEIRASLGTGEREAIDEQRYERAENFEQGVALLRDKIKVRLAERKNILIALSGKTGSGKTSLAKELRRILAEQDDIKTTIVSTDDFYLPDSEELDLNKLHETLNKLQQGEPVGKLTPRGVILIEGLQTILDETIGQKPDIRAYMTVPAGKRFASRLLRDKQVGFRTIKESLKKLAELTPDTVASIQKFEADPSMQDVDVVVNKDREKPDEAELYISGNTLVFSVSGAVRETIEIAPNKIPFLEQIGIRRK